LARARLWQGFEQSSWRGGRAAPHSAQWLGLITGPSPSPSTAIGKGGGGIMTAGINFALNPAERKKRSRRGLG
jgi:hypothetical protein